MGALMLTMIVVVAFSSFAIFISEKQEAVQQQELLDLERDLEKLEVLKVVPGGSDGIKWRYLNFTVANLHTGESRISGMMVNDLPLRQCDVWRTNASTGLLDRESYTYMEDLIIGPREHIQINVSLVEYDLFIGTLDIPIHQYVKFNLMTRLLNNFEKTFIPPTAIIIVAVEQYWNYSTASYDNYTILDGSLSDHTDDGYIVSWKWTISPEDVECSGRKVRAPIEPTASYHTIVLKVTDNSGLVGMDTITYWY